MKKILFISHDASRSGAPLVLLYLLKWLNSNKENIQLDILFVNGGPLEQDFKEICTKVFIHTKLNNSSNFSSIVYQKIISKLGFKIENNEELFFKKIAANKYDLIYANTVVSIPIAVKIKSLSQQAKLLAHVHELNTVIKMMLPNLNNYINMIDKYIAVSNQVKSNLIDNYNVDKFKVDLVYEFGEAKEDIYKNNEIFTVGASGYAQWRKGDDIFVQVAHYITKNYPSAKINFVWLGNNLDNKHILEADIEKLGLSEVVNFVGEQEIPINYYSNFDVFLLTSREDPFPLVCIEVAHLKKPIICFEKASGTTEVIAKGGGFVVPYLDIEAMAKKVIFYYENPSKIKEDGTRAQELFSDFTPEKICPQLYEKINLLLNNQPN